MKVIRRLIKFFFGFLALLLIALFAFVLTFDANNYKPLIIEQVETATGREFIIDSEIELSIFPWIGLKIENVSLGNEKGFKAKHFAAIKQLDIKVNVLPLLRQEVEINTIRLHGLNVSLEVAKNKTNNWSSLSQPATTGETAGKPGSVTPEADKAGTPVPQETSTTAAGLPLQSLKIKGFEFIDAVIVYDDRSSKTKTTVSGLNLITNEIRFEQPVQLSFAAHIVNSEPAINTQINLATQLTFNKALNEFDFRDFIFTVLTDANEFIPQKEKIEIRADINVLLEEQRVLLKKVKLSALGINTLMDIRVTQFSQAPVIQGEVNVQSFNARKVASRVGIELPEMAKAEALSSLALKTKISLRDDKFQANDFQLMLDESTLSGWIHILDINKQQLRYELAFDRLNINDYMPPVVASPPAKTDNNANRSNVVKDKSTRNKGAQPGAKNTDISSSDAATGDEKIELPVDMMRQLDIQGDFSITRLTALDYDIKQFLLSTKAKNGIIDIKPLSMQLLQGQVKTAVIINVRKEIPAYAIDLKARQIQVATVINPFLEGVMGEKPLSMEGRVNFSMAVKTAGESINQLKRASKGKIILDMKQTAVRGFDPEYYMRSSVSDYVSSKGLNMTDAIMSNYKPRQVTVFDKIYSTINLAQGKARTNDFIMSSKRVQVGASGYVDIIDNKLDMMTSITLPRGKTTVEKILDDPMYVRVYGPFDALEYKLDSSRLKKSTTDVLRNKAKARYEMEKKRLEAKANAEKQRLLNKAKAEEQRLKEKAKKEQQRAEEKARQELKKNTDSYKDKLKNKLKDLF